MPTSEIVRRQSRQIIRSVYAIRQNSQCRTQRNINVASRMGLASANRIASRTKLFNVPSAAAFIRMFQPESDVTRRFVNPLVVAPFQEAFVFLARHASF